MTSDSHPPPRSSPLALLIERATAADGTPPFSDGALVELATGDRSLLWLGPAAALHTATEAEFVVDPDARAQGHGTLMLEHLLRQGSSLFWAHGEHPAARALAASHGLRPVRELLHLEAAVPPAGAAVPSRASSAPSSRPGRSELRRSGAEVLDEALNPGVGDGISEVGNATGAAAATTAVGTYRATAFTPADAEAWLALNARAFAAHPEQGAVTRADLDVLTAEPWFDPENFLLLWDGAELVGYSWMKVERGEGEFYVVGVSPDRQGEGLGRMLVDAGFARLASRGIRTAHLYVEGDNAPALALYRSFGFTRRSIDVQYRARS